MSSLDSIISLVESKVPGALKRYERTPGELLPTGIPAVDECGIRTAALTEIWSPRGCTSGKTSVLVSLMSHVTVEGYFCALVDPSDCFDPAGAEDAVELGRLLWVRCSGQANGSKKGRLSRLEQAFKATDILLQNGGFRLIAVDLGDMEEAAMRKVPMTTWFRFARVAEKTDTALLFLTPYPAAQSCASLTLEMRGVEACWSDDDKPHACLLTHTKHEVTVGRQRDKKQARAEKSEFEIKRWA
jgi:hypothetical protein